MELGYKSPIEIVMGEMRTQYENEIFRAIQDVDVNVDKEELIKALEYDRGQYEKGYNDALANFEWISIEDERKPKNLHEYLCLCSFENSTPEEHCWVMPLKWHAFEGNGVVDRPHFTDEGVEGMRVTHWMELPLPPKGIKRYR